MTLFDIVLLAVAGFAAGAVNAVAGGGTFLTFGALVATGMPTLIANATSAVALTPANLASVAAYRDQMRTHGREILPFLLIGAIGGGIGAWLLILIGDAGFRPMVPWLLMMATLLFAFSKQIRAYFDARAIGTGPTAKIVAYFAMLAMSVYGGFFGAGIGIMMLAGLSILTSGDYHKANATKIAVAFLIQLVSAGLLIAGGLVRWPEAIVTLIASMTGGYLGVGLARRVPENVIRAVVVTIGAALTLIFFLR